MKIFFIFVVGLYSFSLVYLIHKYEDQIKEYKDSINDYKRALSLSKNDHYTHLQLENSALQQQVNALKLENSALRAGIATGYPDPTL